MEHNYLLGKRLKASGTSCFSITAIACSLLKTPPVLALKGSWELYQEQGNHNVNSSIIILGLKWNMVGFSYTYMTQTSCFRGLFNDAFSVKTILRRITG
jgi:hypothetical protein